MLFFSSYIFQGVKIKTEKEGHRVEEPPLPTLFNNTVTDAPSPDSRAVDSIASTSKDPSVDLSLDLQLATKKRKSVMSDQFWEVFISKVEPTKSVELRFQHELANYKAEHNIPLESDPLEWWREQQSNYPLLSSLAKYYLCVPASSVASKRVFSTAGDLVTAQRSCLSGEQVDKLIFLKKNYKYPQ